MDSQLPLRITVVRPPGGVTFRLQRGKTADADLVPPAHASDEQLSFDFTVRVAGDRTSGSPNLRGPFAQGPPADRFIYVNSGTLAGQVDSCWTRRAKVRLTNITWELIDQVQSSPGAVLEARIFGVAKDGGPVCASVPLLDGGWRMVP